MKKNIFTIIIILAISGCGFVRNQNQNDGAVIEHSESKLQKYSSDHERFVQNVFVKEKGDNAISYEYKEVRVDEVAGLAATYCQETYKTPAHLKSINLHKNNSRIAVFHCYEI